MKRKLTKKYSRHSCTIDLLTVLTLYVCATFMICIISLFLHCPHFGRRVYCTFTHHIGKNDISYDAPILWIWRTIYESVYICISRYVCLFKDVLKTLWFLSCHRKVLHIYPFLGHLSDVNDCCWCLYVVLFSKSTCSVLSKFWFVKNIIWNMNYMYMYIATSVLYLSMNNAKLADYWLPVYDSSLIR